MAIQDLEVDLDLKQNLNIYATCKQLDNLNLICNIYDNSVEVDLENYNVRLKAMKADKVPLVQESNIVVLNNVATIMAHEQLTTTSGKTLIELQFINKTTGLKKATFNLVLNVVASTLEVNATISKATYTLLEELENKLDQAGDFLENIDEAIELNSNLETKNTQATSNIADLTTQNTNASSNISNLTTQNNNATPNISNLASLNTQATANIAAMESFGDITVLSQDVTALKSEVTTARGASANLDARLDEIDTSLSEKAKDIDATRTTTSKTVTGAINELNSVKAPLVSPNFTGISTIATKIVATTETAIVTLLNGWTTTIGDTKISKNGNQVTVNLCLTGGVTTNGTTIGTIPLGFRPSTYKFVWGKIENASYVASDAVIMVDPNGAMYFNGSPNGNTRLTFNFSFTI